MGDEEARDWEARQEWAENKTKRTARKRNAKQRAKNRLDPPEHLCDECGHVLESCVCEDQLSE